MRLPRVHYPLLLLIAWSGMVGLGTLALLETTLRQHLALKYPITQCKITVSEVDHGAMIRRGLDVQYKYTVAGKKYIGHRFRYDDHNSALEWAVTATELPRWSTQVVYYNPQDPSDSVLQAGIDGSDLLLLLYALPLNVLTLTLWRGFIGSREISSHKVAGGAAIARRGSETRVWMGDISPVAAGGFGMALAAFCASFPIVVVAGFKPSLELMKIVWSIIFLTGAVAFLWRWAQKRAGLFDLRINPEARTVILPKTAGRAKPVAIPRGEISGVLLQRRVSRRPSGTYYTYLPALFQNGGATQAQTVRLVNWGWPKDRAVGFGQWLSKELGVDYRGTEEEVARR
jgi:hypothetical protein